MLDLVARAAKLTSSEVVMTEVRRAVHRTAAEVSRFDLSAALRMADIYLELTRLHPIRRSILRRAGDFFEPKLHALDAIHVVSALEIRPIDFFVTYDQKQATTARLAGLPTISPGA
jgi:hypothetical protein